MNRRALFARIQEDVAVVTAVGISLALPMPFRHPLPVAPLAKLQAFQTDVDAEVDRGWQGLLPYEPRPVFGSRKTAQVSAFTDGHTRYFAMPEAFAMGDARVADPIVRILAPIYEEGQIEAGDYPVILDTENHAVIDIDALGLGGDEYFIARYDLGMAPGVYIGMSKRFLGLVFARPPLWGRRVEVEYTPILRWE